MPHKKSLDHGAHKMAHLAALHSRAGLGMVQFDDVFSSAHPEKHSYERDGRSLMMCFPAHTQKKTQL